MHPLPIFRRVAVAEAITWALLLIGMFLKYVTETTELGVQVFGMVHGVVFIAYCLTTLLISVDQRWGVKQTTLGLVSAVPPFMTLWFERYAERRTEVAPQWRLTTEEPRGAVERAVAWLLRNPLLGVGVGVVAVAALTGVALVAGPPAG